MQKDYDYLIIGAGLFGSTFAFFAKQHNKRCLVIDRRSTRGGNLYCEQKEGINIHRYGAHIFHTSNKSIWDFVNHFVSFNRFTNTPVAKYKSKLYNLPFNMNTFYQIWGVTTPREAKTIIEKQRGEALSILEGREPANLEEQALLLVGRDIYEILVKGYTEKQWGRKCKDLPAFIIKRLPFRFVFDNNYFNDSYQGIPIGGYNKLIDKLLDGIETRLNCDYIQNRNELDQIADKILYTGALDEYFDFCFGKLEYRTVCFETETLDIPNFQGNAVVNYTDSQIPFTRIIEHKHFEMFGQSIYNCPKTIISREYSLEWKPGMEPYYPVNDDNNLRLYKKYLDKAQSSNVIFGGRLADYAYYDMDKVIEKAIEKAKTEL